MVNQYLAYNGYDFSLISPYLHFVRKLPGVPKRDLVTENLARGEGKKLLETHWREKEIVREGYFDAPDRPTADAIKDALLFRLSANEANLDIYEAGIIRTYKASMANLVWTNIEEGRGTFSISFVANIPFGSDTSQTTLSFGGAITDTPHDFSIAIDGSYYAEIVLVAAITSLTSGTAKDVQISNTTTGESITVTRDWSGGDSLVLDVPNKAVTVNGALVDYNGVFPRWQPGTGILRYSDTFSARNVTLTGSYFKRYL